MKKLFTLFLTMFLTAFLFQVQAQMLFDFDTANADVGFGSWGGTGFAKIANPHSEGSNVSANVGQYTHAGNDSGLENDLVAGATPLTPIDFTATPYISVKVWVSKPVAVSIKLQNYPDWGQGHEEKIQVDQINQWVNLIFSYEGITATNYDRAQIYFDKDKSGGSVAGDIYYFDDYQKGTVAPAATTTYFPADGATDVQAFTNISISSNSIMRMIDDSDITDLSTVAWLKSGSATGTDVLFTGSISTDKKVITFTPSALLDYGTTYFYGVSDNVIEYSSDQTAVTGVSASFATIATAPSMVVYNDFETDGVSLCALVETMGDPAPPFSLVEDPAGAGNQVLKFEKNDSWGGWSRVHLELEQPMDLTGDKIFSMRVYSPITTYVRLKIGNVAGDGSHNYEKDADVTVVAGWQTLYFDFSAKYAADADALTANDFTHISIYFGGGDGTANVYYLDDFKGPALIPVDPFYTIDFETIGNDWTWTMFSNSDADSTFYSNVVNPDKTGINTSDSVAKYVIKDAADPWAGVFSADIDDFTFDASNKILTLMVYKDVISNFTLKFEGDAGNIELKVPNTKINEWEELSFDFTSKIGVTYKVITIIPDFPDTRTVGSTNYWDNISVPVGDVIIPPLVGAPVIDYETVGNTWTWNMFANNGDDPANYSVASNPNKTGLNTSDNVAKFVVIDGADPWAGLWSADIEDFLLDETNCFVKVMVYKDVVSNFGLKLEYDGGSLELKTPGTVANEWEVLTFDFTDLIDKTIKTIVIMPDFSDPRTAGSTNHWDNITFNAVPTPVATIDYETVGNDWTWVMFANSGDDPLNYSVVSNPDNTGINTSDSVAMYTILDTADPWAGLWTDDVVDFVVDETNCFVKIMVYKDVVSNFGFKFEGAGGLNVEIKTPGTVANEWEELTFDFTAQIGKTVSRIVVLPDFPDARTAGSTNYWDNISFNAVEAATGLEELDKIELHVYPNPASDYLYISNISDLKRVDIYSITGQKVRTFEFLNNKIQIAELPQGIYVITAESKSGELFTTKFFKY